MPSPNLIRASTLKKNDNEAMEQMRKRMAEQNVVEEIIVKTSFLQTQKEKILNFWKQNVIIKSAEFREHFDETQKVTEYDIRSLWLLPGDWWIRKKLVWLIEWKSFENFITIIILANSVMLACSDYEDRIQGDQYISMRNLNMGQVDTAFTIIFLVECISKILSMGFILHKNSYMRDRWNWLDIFVVSVSVVTWLPGVGNNSSMKSLRTFRILRPLRSINSMPSMKALIQSLLSSLPGLMNVGLFLAFIFTIFAIFGANQFSGSQYMRCRMTDAPTLVNGTTNEYEWPINFDAPWLCSTDSDCERMLGNGVAHKCSDLLSQGLPIELDKPWTQDLIMYDIVNFNNVPIALYTTFQCLTLEGWSLLMYNYMDSNNPYIAVIYFCFMVIFGSFFAMQLVLANIMDSFATDQAKKAEMLAAEAEAIMEKENLKDLFINAAKAAIQPGDPRPLSELALAINDPSAKPIQNAQVSDQQNNVKENEQSLNDFRTNRKENFPQEKQQVEAEESDEFENETIYEIYARERSEKNFFYKKIYAMINHPFYNFIVFSLIISNTITLACDDYPQSLKKQAVLSILNDFFTWAFTVEMLIKMIGLGVNNYIHDSFNLFDAIVVSLSLLDWTLNQVLNDEQKQSLGSGLQALRALRLLRIIKLARSWTKFQDIIRKTVRSLKDISNFGVLLFLFLYIYALLGMDLFANQIRLTWKGEIIEDIPSYYAADGIMIAPRYNFDNVYNSLIVCFCSILAEDWNNSMYSFVLPQIQSQYLVMFYFLTLLIIGNTILLSLFTAILLQNFDSTPEEEEAAANKPKSNFSVRQIFTKQFLIKAKNSIIRIFETRDKKSKSKLAKQIKEQKEQQEADSQSQKTKMLQDNNNKSQIGSMGLFHYEIHENNEQSKTRILKPKQKEDLTGYSFYIFGPKNVFRLGCYEIQANEKYFGNFIIFLILVSTTCLAVQSPLDDPDGSKSTILGYIDYFMTGFFICEMLTKFVALGFAFCGKDSYIRSPWNILDFVIVLSASISVCFASVQIGFLKSLRVMRVLRPLRLLAKHRGLKLAISALYNSQPNIANLLLIVFFFLFMVAILCCTFFQGAFWYCSVNHLLLDDFTESDGIITRYDCLLYGGEWINKDFMFDNVPQSILTLLCTQSTEGWVDTMWQMIDVSNIEYQPVRDSKRIYCLFAILCTFIITLLFLNLFVGVVIETFNQEKDELSLNKLLKKIEKTWIETMVMCYDVKPNIITQKSNKKFRDFMIKLCDSKLFNDTILACILGNTLALTLVWYGQKQQIIDQLEIVNYIFGGIFTIEAIFKIFAYRKNYFRDAWNKFDFSVVTLTWIVAIIMSSNLGIDISILGMIARTLRIGRIFRIVKRVPAIQIILQTLLEAIPAISALALLLGLLFFLYTIIGMSQFAFIKFHDQLNDHVNFQSFFTGALTLMRDSTGEAWDSIMFDCMRQRSILFQCEYDFDYYSWMNNGKVMNGCGNTGIAVAFFYTFTVIVCQIFLNLFIAVIIDSFLGQSQAFNMPVNSADIDDFIECWQHFDPDGLGTIECYNLEKFIIRLSQTESRLIANRKRILKDGNIRRKLIAQLEIPSHNDFSFFRFTDVLLCMSRLIVQASFIRDECYAEKLQKLQKKKEQRNPIQQAYPIVKRNHQIEFKQYINGISSLSDKIGSVYQLHETVKKINKSTLVAFDKKEIEPNVIEIQTSKQYIYGELIVNCWRDFLKAKAEDIKFKENIKKLKDEEGEKSSDSEAGSQLLQSNDRLKVE